MKKLPSELELEQLLQALKDAPEESNEPQDYKNDVLGFINKFNIQTGEYYCTVKFLYSIYKQWSKTPLKYMGFLREINIFFTVVKKNQIPGILLNKSTMSLAPELWDYFKKNRTRQKTKQKSYIKQFDSFRKECKVQPGNTWIMVSVLYSIYMMWRFENKNYTTMTKVVFGKFCGMFFDKKALGHEANIAYKISDSLYEYISRIESPK